LDFCRSPSTRTPSDPGRSPFARITLAKRPFRVHGDLPFNSHGPHASIHTRPGRSGWGRLQGPQESPPGSTGAGLKKKWWSRWEFTPRFPLVALRATLVSLALCKNASVRFTHFHGIFVNPLCSHSLTRDLNPPHSTNQN